MREPKETAAEDKKPPPKCFGGAVFPVREIFAAKSEGVGTWELAL